MKFFLFIIAFFLFATNSFSQNIPGYVPKNGLRAWYPFNGNANDESGNGFNGTPLAEASLTTDRFGNANAAYSFNGNNDSRIITALTGDSSTSERTISFWFNPSANLATVDGHCMVTLAGGTGNAVCGNGFTCSYYYNVPGVDIYCAYVNYSYPTSTNQWYFYTLTYSSVDGNSAFSPKIYINGQLQTSVSDSYNTSVLLNTLNTLQYNFGGNGVTDHNFTGSLDDIGFWNRVLTQTEIAQLYAASVNITTVGSPSLSIDIVDTTTCSFFVKVPVRGKNLSNVSALIASIGWDTTFLNYGGISYGNTGININAVNFDTSNVFAGKLALNWISASGSSATDSAPLFTLIFYPHNNFSGGIGVWFDPGYTQEIDTSVRIAATNAKFMDGLVILSDTPQIVQTGNILQCMAGCSPVHYQWYQNGVAITNDTLNYITATNDGSYTVTVTYISGAKVGSHTYNIILPITLTSFTAMGKEKDVLLQWQTATEINTSEFFIQRSNDGINFNTIGSIKAKGVGNYTYIDNNVFTGKLYYRLQIADANSAISYSPVRTVSASNDMKITIMPNPSHDYTIVSGYNIQTIRVVDNLGRMMITKNNPFLSSYINLDIKHLAKGLYFIQATTVAGEIKTEKLLVE